MASLGLTKVPIDGGLADLAAAAAPATVSGDTAPCGPGRVLYVNNGGGSPLTVTAVSPGRVKGLDIENPALVLAAGKAGLLPLPQLLAGVDGRAAITYSGVTSVTVLALELGS
ncbi:hypothetical protein [Actinocorallia longicatena]|uniref:Uncharacterized protein n=1 Tax=Actinocorallia longicatena TaxID=111803 RepID=A0ABP6QF04_9ACTN